MRELSILADESGDFGAPSAHSPYYLVSLVFHDQASSIARQVSHLEDTLQNRGFPRSHVVHTAPLIRREFEYENIGTDVRGKLFSDIEHFMRHCDIKAKTFVVNKRKFGGGDDLANRIGREIGIFMREHLEYFQGFDRIVVYYDRGQKQLTKTLKLIFSSSLGSVEFKTVRPEDYRLLQVADLVCTLELLDEKRRNGQLSASELAFFGGSGALKKKHLKALYAKRF